MAAPHLLTLPIVGQQYSLRITGMVPLLSHLYSVLLTPVESLQLVCKIIYIVSKRACLNSRDGGRQGWK